MKEYNNRWFVFGFSTCKGQSHQANPYPLDRIVSEIKILDNETYKESEHDYESYFNEFIGVSKTQSKIHKIVFRANDKYIYGLIQTKKIHHTQKTLQEWNGEDGCGRFEISVRTNNELKARFLSFGKGVTIESPEWYAHKIAEEIKEMLNSYLQ